MGLRVTTKIFPGIPKNYTFNSISAHKKVMKSGFHKKSHSLENISTSNQSNQPLRGIRWPFNTASQELLPFTNGWEALEIIPWQPTKLLNTFTPNKTAKEQQTSSRAEATHQKMQRSLGQPTPCRWNAPKNTGSCKNWKDNITNQHVSKEMKGTPPSKPRSNSH